MTTWRRARPDTRCPRPIDPPRLEQQKHDQEHPVDDRRGVGDGEDAVGVGARARNGHANWTRSADSAGRPMTNAAPSTGPHTVAMPPTTIITTYSMDRVRFHCVGTTKPKIGPVQRPAHPGQHRRQDERHHLGAGHVDADAPRPPVPGPEPRTSNGRGGTGPGCRRRPWPRHEDQGQVVVQPVAVDEQPARGGCRGRSSSPRNLGPGSASPPGPPDRNETFTNTCWPMKTRPMVTIPRYRPRSRSAVGPTRPPSRPATSAAAGIHRAADRPYRPPSTPPV